MRGASDAPFAAASGVALYAGALDGADIVHRPRRDGTEDFVVFETRPAREELAYDVDAGASSCDVRIAWASDVYPAIVDPAWTTTGSMRSSSTGPRSSPRQAR